MLDAGELAIEAAVEIGQALMVEAHEVKNRGVEVPDVMAVLDRLMPDLVGGPVAGAGLDSSAGKPIGKALGVVITAVVVSLGDRLAAELSTPDHQGVFEKPALLQVGEQSGNRLVNFGAMNVQVLLNPVVSIPVLLLVPTTMVDLYKTNTTLNKAARDEALTRKRSRPDRKLMPGFRIIDTVELTGPVGFLLKVKGLRGRRLQLEGELLNVGLAHFSTDMS